MTTAERPISTAVFAGLMTSVIQLADALLTIPVDPMRDWLDQVEHDGRDDAPASALAAIEEVRTLLDAVKAMQHSVDALVDKVIPIEALT